MSPDDDELALAAENCDDCLCWLKHCHAECCREFTFWVTPESDIEYETDRVTIHVGMTPDIRHYYALHGANVEGDHVSVPRDACERTSDRLVVRLRCTALEDDLRCALHGADQPECCSGFTLETAWDGEWVVTPNCLFGLKRTPPGGAR